MCYKGPLHKRICKGGKIRKEGWSSIIRELALEVWETQTAVLIPGEPSEEQGIDQGKSQKQVPLRGERLLEEKKKKPHKKTQPWHGTSGKMADLAKNRQSTEKKNN